MPIFEYKCPACGATKDVVVLPTEIVGDVLCPCHCYMKRQLSAANFKINGYSDANGYSRKDTNVKAK